MSELSQWGRDDVQLVEDETSFEGFFQVRTLRLRHRLYAGGYSETITRQLVKQKDAVGVLLYDPVLDAVALVEQFRIGVVGNDFAQDHGISPWLLEIVAGLIDLDESPAEVARRESVEETATLIQELEPIAQYFSTPGGSSEYVHLFVGRADLSDTGGVHGLAEEAEDIRVHVLPVARCWSLLATGALANAHALIAIQWLQLNHLRIRDQWS